jgi:CPA1 family monovalent cation:H+ antiporter
MAKQAWYVEAKAVWDMVEFLLTGLVFILIGFQLPVAFAALNARHGFADLGRYSVIVAGVVVGARLLWVFPAAYLPRWFDRVMWGRNEPYPSWRVVIVVGWAGMRGVVSLAAAMALPATVGSDPFPSRNLILFLAFAVILVTLVGQGLTLPLLIRGLGVSRLAPQEEGGGQHESESQSTPNGLINGVPAVLVSLQKPSIWKKQPR